MTARQEAVNDRLYVQEAFFCADVSADNIGALTFTGVSNQKLITAHTTGPVPEMPVIGDSVKLVLGFASMTLRGHHSVDVTIIRPNGSQLGELVVEFEMPEPELTRPVVQTINLPWEIEGTYWFEVRYKGELLTQVPLQINYKEVRSQQ